MVSLGVLKTRMKCLRPDHRDTLSSAICFSRGRPTRPGDSSEDIYTTVQVSCLSLESVADSWNVLMMLCVCVCICVFVCLCVCVCVCVCAGICSCVFVSV